jgi:hypothetical protein
MRNLKMMSFPVEFVGRNTRLERNDEKRREYPLDAIKLNGLQHFNLMK